MKKLIKALPVVFTFILLIIAGCAEEKAIVNKPDVVVVERTATPFAGAVWVDNEYRWDGRTYVIVPAHWVKPKGAWVPGHWKQVTKGYVWVPGHWR